MIKWTYRERERVWLSYVTYTGVYAGYGTFKDTAEKGMHYG